MGFKVNQIVVAKAAPKVTKQALKYPWNKGEALLYLGEIVQMPDHCIVVNKAGQIFWGYHTDNFRQPRESEI